MNLVVPMTLVVLTSLVAACTSQYNRRNSYYDDNSPRYNIPTRNCVCDSRVAPRCPPVGYCPTGTVRRCGCCPTCYRLLDAGERCDRRLPVNEMCRQPMVCLSSVCQRPTYQNRYK